MNGIAQPGRLPVEHQAPSNLDVVLEADVRELTVLRRRVRAWLPERGLTEEQVNEIQLIVTELTANAMAASAPGHAVELHCRSTHTRIVVEVTNHSRSGGRRPTIPLSSQDGVPWSGLRLVESFSDRVTAETLSTSTTVRCFFTL